jgi:hypothetical protein
VALDQCAGDTEHAEEKVSPPLFADILSRVNVSLSLFCVLNPDANLSE